MATTQEKTTDIPKNQWSSFLNEFTKENRSAHGSIEIMGGEQVSHSVEVEGRPFDGISADYKDGEDTIWITFGTEPDNRIAHGITGAKAIHTRPESGSDGPAIEIEANDGSKTIVQLDLPSKHELPSGGRR